jgi:hypothetical protein
VRAQAEIGKLDLSVLVEEDVFGFDVPVSNFGDVVD